MTKGELAVLESSDSYQAIKPSISSNTPQLLKDSKQGLLCSHLRICRLKMELTLKAIIMYNAMVKILTLITVPPSSHPAKATP